MTRAGLGLEDIRAVRIPLLSRPEQHEIVIRVETAFSWLDNVAAEYTSAAHLLPKLDQAILAKAFRGDLVSQDPNDEAASELLARIRAARAEAPKQKRGRRPHSKTTLHAPGEKAAMIKSRHDEDVKDKPYLANLLREIGKLASVEELFKRAQLPVTDFYK